MYNFFSKLWSDLRTITIDSQLSFTVSNMVWSALVSLANVSMISQSFSSHWKLDPALFMVKSSCFVLYYPIVLALANGRNRGKLSVILPRGSKQRYYLQQSISIIIASLNPHGKLCVGYADGYQITPRGLCHFWSSYRHWPPVDLESGRSVSPQRCWILRPASPDVMVVAEA